MRVFGGCMSVWRIIMGVWWLYEGVWWLYNGCLVFGGFVDFLFYERVVRVIKRGLWVEERLS